MANTCIVYGKALTLHRVSNSVAKLAKITARSNNKNYLNFSYMDYTTAQINWKTQGRMTPLARLI